MLGGEDMIEAKICSVMRGMIPLSEASSMSGPFERREIRVSFYKTVRALSN